MRRFAQVLRSCQIAQRVSTHETRRALESIPLRCLKLAEEIVKGKHKHAASQFVLEVQ